MKFLYPEVLILIPFLFLFLFVKNSKKVSISSKIILNQKESNFKIYFLFASIIFMIIALARPVNHKKEIEVKTSLPVVAIAIDSSYSMFAKDIYPNRFEFAKLKAKKLIDKLNAKIALFVFSNNISLISPPTDDKSTLKEMIDNIPTSYLPTKGTSIQNLIDTIKDMKINNLIILSDGGDEKKLDTKGVNLYVLLTATQKGSPLYSKGEMIKDKNGNIVISKANEDILKYAKMGVLYSLSDSDVNKIASQNFTKNQNLKNKIFVYNELFYYPLILAILFFSFAIFSFPKRNLALILLLFMPFDLKAGILDFYTIDKANNFYKNGEYQKAVNEYGKLNSNEAVYDKANSLYKLKKYDEAIKTYNQIKTDDKIFKSKILYNEANSLYYEKKLDEAIKKLKQAQKLNPKDEDIKNNLEFMEKQKKKQQKKQNKKDNKNNKNNKNQKQNNSNKNKNNQQNHKKSDKQNKQNKSKNNSDKKQNNQKQKNSEKNKNNQNKKQNQNKNNDKQNNGNKQNKQKDHNKNRQIKQNQAHQSKKKEGNKKEIDIKTTNKNILNQIKTPTLLYPVGENKGESQNEW